MQWYIIREFKSRVLRTEHTRGDSIMQYLDSFGRYTFWNLLVISNYTNEALLTLIDILLTYVIIIHPFIFVLPLLSLTPILESIYSLRLLLITWLSSIIVEHCLFFPEVPYYSWDFAHEIRLSFLWTRTGHIEDLSLSLSLNKGNHDPKSNIS